MYFNLGHLAQDCFHVAGGKAYDLLEDEEEDLVSPDKSAKHKSSKSKKKVRLEGNSLSVLSWTKT